MPVFCLALSRVEVVDWWNALGIFILLHLFIYPASNGYNSYIDRDETPIGGLEHPPEPSRNLFWAAFIFDLLGLAIALLIHWQVFLLVAGYMLASRAYSSPQIRLKGMPIVGFLTVMAFQGAGTFATVYLAASGLDWAGLLDHWPVWLGSSILIGGVYPLTQVYQHEADRASGDHTISLLLGYRGTFVFSILMFAIAGGFIFYEFHQMDQIPFFLVFLGFLLPVIAYFNWWMLKVWKDHTAANFKNAMRMNALAATCMNLAFLIITAMQWLP